MEYTFQHNSMNGNLPHPCPCPEVTMQDPPPFRSTRKRTTNHWSHQLLVEFQNFVQTQAPPPAIKASFESDCMDVEMADATTPDNTTTMMEYTMYDAQAAIQITVEDFSPLMGLGDCQMVDA